MQLASRIPEPLEHPMVGVFRRRWSIVAITCALTLAATAVFTAQQPPTYRASTSLVVVPEPGVGEASDVLRSLDTLDRRTVIATFARLPSTPESRAAATDVLGLSSDDLAGYRVIAGVVPSTNIIKIDIEGSDPTRAAELSNAVAQVVSRNAPQLYPIFALRVIERAVPRRSPISPDIRRNLVVGAIVGLLLGAACAAAGDYFYFQRGTKP